MPPSPKAVRDGVMAVAAGAMIALLVMFGMRAAQLTGLTARPGVPRTTAVPAPDACELQGGLGGGTGPDPTVGGDFPRQDFTLAVGSPVRVSGNGNAEIAYERLGEFATVVAFDCVNCVQDLTVLNTATGIPIVSGEMLGEPIHVEWLIDTVSETAGRPDNSLLIRAQGDWSLTLRTWFDLPVSSGTIRGSGSRVVRTTATFVRLTFAPLNSRDMLNVYSYRLADKDFRSGICLGRRESHTLDLNGGEVVLLWARGDWVLEPL